MEVWLTKQEKQDEILRKRLETFCQQYKEKSYFVAIFASGSQDLAEETSALLRYNRKRLAEQEARSKRACASGRLAAR